MRRFLTFQRLITVVLGINAFVLACVVALPHHHDPASISHHADSCRVCKIHEAFSAAPSPALATNVQPILVASAVPNGGETPCLHGVIRLVSSRAPPISS